MNYGQAPAYAPYPGAGYASHAMAPYRGALVFGADAPQTTGEKVTAFLDEPTLGVANKWWLTGAALAGLAWYGHSARWF